MNKASTLRVPLVTWNAAVFPDYKINKSVLMNVSHKRENSNKTVLRLFIVIHLLLNTSVLVKALVIRRPASMSECFAEFP